MTAPHRKGRKMTEEQRLAFLTEAFKEDSIRYRDLETPPDIEGKRRLLRSLLNLRPPKPLAGKILRIQDEYLRERAREKGIVTLREIPAARGRLSLWQGDITRLRVDAIVNAANNEMLGCFVPMHSCIDNCIHSFAGVELRRECFEKMESLRARYGTEYTQPTAVPILTEGYNLPARKVIHVVGPIVEGRLEKRHEEELAACYRNVLDLCRKNGLRSVAFCAISTGVFSFPGKRASKIAVKTVEAWLREDPDGVDRVIFNVFKDEDRRYYEALLL